MSHARAAAEMAFFITHLNQAGLERCLDVPVRWAMKSAFLAAALVRLAVSFTLFIALH
jgi:hypothetical protein